MPRVSLWFFAVAPVYALIGMSFGIFMGASEDFTLAPAHAHLNLLGWATMALYGTFYALAGEKAPIRLAWATFWLGNASVIIMFPSLSLVLTYGNLPQYLLPLVVSEILIVLGMLSFALSVWSVLMKESQVRPSAAIRPSAAE